MFDRLVQFFSKDQAAIPDSSREPAETCKDRGNAHLALDELDAAAECYRQAVSIDPTYAEAYNNLGVVLQRQGDSDGAMALFHQALLLKPSLARAHLNCGNVQMAEGLFDEAVGSFHDALSFDPTLAEAHNNLGNLFQTRNQLDDALTCFETAVRLNPGLAEAHFNLGDLLKERGLPQHAVACFQRAIQLKAGFAEAHFSLATALLSCGHLPEGWKQYKYRFDIHDDNPIRRTFAAPEWSGQELTGKTILVWGDQGVGDEMLFASLLPEIIARTGRCVVECTHKLVPLFAASFPRAIVVPRTTPPHPATRDGIDFQIAAADAARWLRPDLGSFPRHHGYLSADLSRISYWKARLAGLGYGLKVGFSWRSSLSHGRRNLHYTSLDQWGPIFAVPGVHFINLQYDNCADELTAARQRFGIPLHTFEEVDLFDDLLEAAALNQALDLVISAPTATSLLSAALGVPAWMMSYASPWQMLGTDHVPWFPAMRCFPRRWDQSWEEIIASIGSALQSFHRKSADV